MITSRRAASIACALLLSQYSAWAEPNAAAPAERCDRGQFRVIVDVGHTAEVPGAFSARGIGEYEFNLRLATNIRQKLVDSGFTRTHLLITAGPARPGLLKRVAVANRSPADLFLSIHHDSVPTSFKEIWEYEGKQHKFSDRFKGHSIFVSYDNTELNASLLFGKLLGAQMKTRGLQYTPHYTEPFMGQYQHALVDAEAGVYRFDQLIVLRKTQMPAVLLEAGSIINREEELLMASIEHQALISDAVTEAMTLFCAARSRDRDQPLPRQRPAGKPEPVSAASTNTRR
jgi:N-acetylmuramoyl-L-alanine amidase